MDEARTVTQGGHYWLTPNIYLLPATAVAGHMAGSVVDVDAGIFMR